MIIISKCTTNISCSIFKVLCIYVLLELHTLGPHIALYFLIWQSCSDGGIVKLLEIGYFTVKSLIKDAPNPNFKCFSSRLAVVFVQSIETQY